MRIKKKCVIFSMLNQYAWVGRRTQKEEETMSTKRNRKTVYMVQLALLIAIILIMAFTPIGYIKTLGLEITLIVVPVAVGAVILGPLGGAILGAVFGLTSFLQCFGLSPFGEVLLGINPVFTFIVCFIPRVGMGWLTGLIYKGLCKAPSMKHVKVVIANLCAPLLNTLFFMTALIVLFYQSDYIQGFVASTGASNVFAFIVAFVGFNGLIEAGLNFVVGSAITKALQVALKNV